MVGGVAKALHWSAYTQRHGGSCCWCDRSAGRANSVDLAHAMSEISHVKFQDEKLQSNVQGTVRVNFNCGDEIFANLRRDLF